MAKQKELVVKISCGRDDWDITTILNALQAWNAGSWIVEQIDPPPGTEWKSVSEFLKENPDYQASNQRSVYDGN
jgi:hypothetical protein